MSHIVFIEQDTPPGLKTRRWRVEDLKGNTLGIVQWLGAWRKYVFQPAYPTAFDEGCLIEIADFIETHTIDRKAAG